MDAFGPERYVPVLLTKRGERRALEDLSSSVKDGIAPLFVVHEVDWDYDIDQPKKTLAEHIANLPEELAKCWGRGAFLDLNESGDDSVGGDHPLTWLHAQGQAHGIAFTPVATPTSSPAYMDAVRVLVGNGSDVCLRLQIDHWPAAAGPQELDALLADLDVEPDECHLVLDMGDDVGSAAGRLVAAELRHLPNVAEWLSVTAAATAIPENMPPGAGLHVVTRHDWRIYIALRSLPGLPRYPSFGDYTINGTSLGVDINPAVMQIAATLRYATDDEWLVAKGGLWKAHGGQSLGAAAVPPAASLLVTNPAFAGAGHCLFEDWLIPVSAGTGGSNPEMWRRLGTHHHINATVAQIANLGAP